MSEFVQAGLGQHDIETASAHAKLLIQLSQSLEPCPNRWVVTELVSGYGHNADEAEKKARDLAKAYGKLKSEELNKQNCEKYSCEEEGNCVFGWGLIGKPTKAVKLEDTTTEPDDDGDTIEVKDQWESQQKIGYGCFCKKKKNPKQKDF